MQQLKWASNVLGFFLMILMVCSCGKDGDVGPQGAQGPAGAQGDDGDDGTANVIYSGWFDSQFAANIASTAAGFDKVEPKITQSIVDNGVVLVYGKIFTGSVYLLPYTSVSAALIYYNNITLGQIRIIVNSTDGADIGNPNFFGQYRYVIIPGGTSASGRKKTDYASMSYEEVAALFNIPE